MLLLELTRLRVLVTEDEVDLQNRVRPLARPPTFTHLLTLLSSTFLSLYPVHGPSYIMRSVALSALLVVAAASASNADETPKPVFKVRSSALTRK